MQCEKAPIMYKAVKSRQLALAAVQTKTAAYL